MGAPAALPDLWQIGANFGVAGLLIVFMCWKDNNDRRDRRDREKRLAEERRERLEADKAQAESNNRLAAALSALATIITGRPHV